MGGEQGLNDKEGKSEDRIRDGVSLLAFLNFIIFVASLPIYILVYLVVHYIAVYVHVTQGCLNISKTNLILLFWKK